MEEEKQTEIIHLTKAEATQFFSDFYGGEHHIPNCKINDCGYGFSVQHSDCLSTFDFHNLTKFVIMCHDRCIRGEVSTSRPGYLKIAIWKRQGREGNISMRHPTIESQIERIRALFNKTT